MTKIVVELNGVEVKLANYVGKLRYLANRKKGIIDEKVGKQGHEETDIDSMGAEIAFAKQYNTYPDIQLEERPDYDALLPCGAGVDIKQTKYPNGRLLVRTKKRGKAADIYVLVTGTLPVFTIVGGYPSDLVFVDDNLIDLGYGKTYAIDQDRLWPIDKLIWRYEFDIKDNRNIDTRVAQSR